MLAGFYYRFLEKFSLSEKNKVEEIRDVKLIFERKGYNVIFQVVTFFFTFFVTDVKNRKRRALKKSAVTMI